MESTIHEIVGLPFHTTDWKSIPVTEKAGATGTAKYQSMEFKGFRMRLVEYSGNYEADHWCKVGHIVFCLDGEMISKLDDGREFTLSKGMSYVVGNDAGRHRSFSACGVKLLIIDGNFLNFKQEIFRNPWRM